MRSLLIFSLLSVLSFNRQIYSQDSIYFNKIYNPNNTYAKGRGIVQIDDYYYCLFGTKSTNDIEIMMGLCKLDLYGSLIDYSIIGEANHHYFPGNVGGTLIKTNDGNLAFSIHIQDINTAYATLLKLNLELDTIWKRNYYTENFWTLSFNCRQTSDNGYILVGSVAPTEESYWDCLLLKTDSVGNMLWYQTYSYPLQEEGESVIETPDGGYLLGGFRYDPAVYHSLDALVIKTDSLGNEEWTKTFGNPNVDDDMAHVALADDGNYLVATVYGEWIFSYETRAGKQCIYKLNQQGQTIETFHPGVLRIVNHIRSFRKIDESYIMTGFSYETDSVTYQLHSGWMMKLDHNLDSLWYRDYIHYGDESAENLLYDMSPSLDAGYIATGYARSGTPGQSEKLWIIKVDSMGCDTAGCATGVFIKEISFINDKEITAFPNPAETEITLAFQNTEHHNNQLLSCYNIYGQKVHSEKIYKGQQQTRLKVSGWSKGIYLAIIRSNQTITGQTRFIIK